MAVVIHEPSNHQQIDHHEVMVKAEIVAANKVKKTTFLINGEVKDENTTDKRIFTQIFYLEDGVYTIKVKAEDEKGNQSEAEVKIGVNKPWDWQPTPIITPTPTPTPTSTPAATPTPLPTISG